VVKNFSFGPQASNSQVKKREIEIQRDPQEFLTYRVMRLSPVLTKKIFRVKKKGGKKKKLGHHQIEPKQIQRFLF